MHGEGEGRYGHIPSIGNAMETCAPYNSVQI